MIEVENAILSIHLQSKIPLSPLSIPSFTFLFAMPELPVLSIITPLRADSRTVRSVKQASQVLL